MLNFSASSDLCEMSFTCCIGLAVQQVVGKTSSRNLARRDTLPNLPQTVRRRIHKLCQVADISYLRYSRVVVLFSRLSAHISSQNIPISETFFDYGAMTRRFHPTSRRREVLPNPAEAGEKHLRSAHIAKAALGEYNAEYVGPAMDRFVRDPDTTRERQHPRYNAGYV